MDRGYREVGHTADLALEVWGDDLPALFVNAARGLFGLTVAVESGAPVTARREVTLSAPDTETLLVDWLNELLLLSDEHDEAYVTFDVSLPTPGELSACVGATQAFSAVRDVKAATFHNLIIGHEAPGYRTTIVFDV